MTIEYKDSKRIVKLSTDKVERVTYTGDMSTGWTTGNAGSGFTLDGTNDEIDFLNNYGNDNVAIDLNSLLSGSISTSWVLRFAIEMSGTASGDNIIWWNGVSSDASVEANSTAQSYIGIGNQTQNGTTGTRTYIAMCNDSRLDSSDVQTRLQLSGSNTADFTGKYYFEIIRDGSNFTVNQYSDSYSTLSGTKTNAVSNEAGGTLRYFISANYQQGSNVTGTLSELKFYDGVSSLTSKPTNVQDNSILIEKDTAKRFWYSPVSADTAWSQTTSNDGVNVQYGTSAETSKLGQKFETNHANVGKTFTQVTVRLKRYTAASGNASAGHIIYCKVYNSSGTARATASTTYVYSTLATSYADKTFTFATPITIGANEIVGFESNGGAYDVETFNFRVNSSSTESDTTMIDYRKGAWGTTFAAWEMMMTLGTPATTTWTYEPNANSSPLFDTHNGTSSSHSTTITVASNDNRLLIAHVAHSSGAGGNAATTVTSVTSNVSGAFTQLMTQTSDSTQNQKTDVWYLKAPATGAHTVTVVYSHTTVSRSIALTSLYNVDQTTPINLSSKAGNGASTGTPITVDITPTVKNSVLMALAQAQYSANTPSDTTIYMASYAGGGDFNISAQKKLSPTRDSSNTMSWSKNSALAWSIIAFEVIGV